ncbi:unnamed protein product [Rotaria magnacalcarata]|uniref:Uncharacterized protein n=1 Tax=Rotaria magnacalcarata TaxID=392030 RepID=A0A816TKE3_9BILA|nr:unnamed protein product [Rotaria magnacalcarata]
MLKTQARIDNGQFRQIYDCEISAIRQAFDAAEAIPSIVHQADIAAFNERDLFYNNEASPTTSVDRHYGPLQNPSPNNCTYEILYVHDNLKNLPVLG